MAHILPTQQLLGSELPTVNTEKKGKPGPKLRKLFSCSAQLRLKFKLLVNVEIVKISGKFRFKTRKLVLYPAHKC